MKSKQFAGQVAIISGGLGDIGAAIARRFASCGAALAIGDLHPPAAARPLLDEIIALGQRAIYNTVDVSNPIDMIGWVDEVTAALGPPTLVIASAATVSSANILDITPEQWSRDLRINLDGAFYFAQACARKMRDHKSDGRILLIGSWAAHAAHPSIPAYCVSKAGLRMLCRVMALELAPHGILVNEIAPGYVDAGLSKAIWEKDPSQRERAHQQVPANRLITADEVASEAAHLCSPDNRHMTGSTILMDGGLSLVTASAARGRPAQ